ncbi:hypothetical protein GCM10022200_01710 [Microbacterium awajiense]|uniref:Uncharacterized protein n=1 Tax=Microbacterium awajiense TaxID=415214 RepID=A0ABP7A1I7_9MICO
MWVVFGAILLALLIIAAAFWYRVVAEQRLAAEQARTNVLISEIAALSDVSAALSTRDELTDFRTEAMASDLTWSPVLRTITSVLPAGTTVTGLDFTAGGAPQSGDPTLEQGLVGTVTFDSPTPIDIVPLIRALRATDGVYYADGQSVTSSQANLYSYVLTVEFDQTVYSQEYAQEEGGE